MHHNRGVELEPLIHREHIEVMSDVLESGVEVVLADMPLLGGLFGRLTGPAPCVELDVEAVFGAELSGSGGDGFEVLVEGDVDEGFVGRIVSHVLLQDLEGKVEVIVAEDSGAEDADVVLAREGFSDTNWYIGGWVSRGGLGGRHFGRFRGQQEVSSSGQCVETLEEGVLPAQRTKGPFGLKYVFKKPRCVLSYFQSLVDPKDVDDFKTLGYDFR